MGVFNDACNIAHLKYKNYKKETFQMIMKEIRALDYEVHKGTNKKAIKELTDELRNLVSVDKSVTDDMF